MIKFFSFLVLVLLLADLTFAQKSIKVKNKTDFNSTEIDSVKRAYQLARISIKSALHFFDTSFNKDSKNLNWLTVWNNDKNLVKWFGEKDKISQIKRIKRRVRKMDRKARKTSRLIFHPYNQKGLCRGSRHAWTIPKGLVKIHICQQFMYKPFQLWSKIFIHELAHESGILFHRRIYWRESALRAAEKEQKIASRNPENYAFFIMEFWTD